MKITNELIQFSNQWVNPIYERQLDLKGNKFSNIENLGATLDFFNAIDLSDNEISKLSNFSVLKKLKTLLICNNRIQKISDLSQSLPLLENLMLTNNKIQDLTEIDNLSNCQNLQRLCLINNQITQQKDYRLYVISRIPSLKILDFQKVKKQEREQAQKLREEFQQLNNAAKLGNFQNKQQIQKLIENCNSIEEINRLELLLKKQQIKQ